MRHASIDLSGHYHAGRHRSEEPTEALRWHFVQHDEDERGARDVSKGSRRTKAAHYRSAYESPVLEQARIRRLDESELQRTPGLVRQRFGQAEVHADKAGRAEQRLNDERRIPSEPDQQVASDERCNYGRNAEHQDQHRKNAAQFAGGKKIGDHGARHHRTSTCADGLHQPGDGHDRPKLR